MNVKITRAAPSQREVVGRLLEFNAYEFSRLDGRSIGNDGSYGYPCLDAYWSEPDRVPYLMWADGELAGLALVRRVAQVLCVAELLVLPKFRRAGVGTRAAHQVFAAHPGAWSVRQAVGNDEATEFWRRAIPFPLIEDVDHQGAVIQRFNT